MDSRPKTWRGLNKTPAGRAPRCADDYKPSRQSPTVPEWKRLKVMERMLKDSKLDQFKYKGRFGLKEWKSHYSIQRNYKNRSGLDAIRHTKLKTLADWWMNAKNQGKMDSLRKRVTSRRGVDAKTRCRVSSSRQIHGETPFAERVVILLREIQVLRSANHGVRWMTWTYNRVLSTPWIYQVARPYISEQERLNWKDRGVVTKTNINKMRVCT